MEIKSDLQLIKELRSEIDVLARRIERERSARKSSEELLEKKSLELYESNQQLKTLNESLQKNIARRTNTLTSLIRNLHAGILLEDENRRVILTNDLFCEMFKIEWSPEDLVGTDCSDSADLSKVLFKEPEKFVKGVDACILDRVPITNVKLEMVDGRVLERDFLPIFSKGEYMGHLWQYRDITEQFYYEEQVRKSEEKYRGVMENMDLGLIEVDLDHNIMKAYDRFCDMTGYSEQELVGKNAMEMFLPEKYAKLMTSQDQKRENGQPSVYEVQVKKKNGELIWVLISGAPFFDDKGKVTGSVGIHYDLTERKNLENDLREARQAADRAREAEKEFLANMSHEIRNPINAIVGIISLLYDTSMDKEQLEYLDNIKYSADVLLGLISDILDLSKIEAGKMELNEKDVDLNEIIETIVATYKFKSKDKGVQFSYNANTQLSTKVEADSTVLNQIFLNLLGNALKFTEKGNIWVETEVLKETDDFITAQFRVRDTGIGISEEQKERIFESFNQADRQTKLKYGGTGLGLSIVRQLIGYYGGTVDVESELGKGSSFNFTLTLNKSRQKEEPAEQPAKARSGAVNIKKVLVVEDNKINQQYLTGLLRKWKIDYDIANHGVEAMDWIEKQVYDLILMDIRMPEMDGYETTIRIRSSHQNPNKEVPIIALTASALVDEKARALAAGMNHHLTKPFSPEQLLGVFEQLGQGIEEEEQEKTFKFSNDLDEKYLIEFYGDDLERAAIMFEIFLKNIVKEIDELKEKQTIGDWERVAYLAHRIKPNFQMVGLTEFTDVMAQIEALAAKGSSEPLNEILNTFFENYKEKHQLVEEELERLKQETT